MRAAIVIGALAVFLMMFTDCVFADLDVNAVAGTATIDGVPAPAGTTIMVRASGHTTTTKVDGANVPPFRRGEGRFDTGDVPQFNTGDRVTISFQDQDIIGQSSKILVAGTTTANLNGRLAQPPSIDGVPDQTGTEDVSWTLDLDLYITDPDTPKSSLTVTVVNPYVTVEDHALHFLYPDGVTSDSVSIRVSDSSSSDTEIISVTIEPVNDPPVVSEIAPLSLMEGSGTSVDLSLHVEDIDDLVESLTWSVLGAGSLETSLKGSLLQISAPQGEIGLYTVEFSVQDPGGLSDTGNIQVEVGANITALMEFYGDQIDGLNAQIGDLLDENSNLSSQLDSVRSEISRLENEKTDLQNQLEEAQSEADSLLDELDALRAQGRVQGEAIALLESEKAQLEAMLSSLEEDSDSHIASYLSTISELNATCHDYMDQIAALNGLVAEIEANVTALESGAEDSQDLIAALKREKEDLQSILDSKELELGNLEELAASLQSRVEGLEEQKTQAEDALNEIELALQGIETENAELKSRLDRLTNRATATIIDGVNKSEGNNTIAGDVFGKAARFARDGIRLVINGMDSSLVLLVVAIIAISSTVTIAARTSWLQIGSTGTHNTAAEFWRTIERRTINDSQSNSPGKPEKDKGDTTNATESSTAGAVTKSSSMMVRRKPTPPPKREKRSVVASSRPVSVRRRKPKMVRALEKLADESQAEPKAKVPERDLVGRQSVPAKPEPPRPEPKEGPSNEGKKEDTSSRSPEKTEDASGKEKPVSGNDLASSNLSKVDRDYIKTLIEMGFTKEAEEELGKRSLEK